MVSPLLISEIAVILPYFDRWGQTVAKGLVKLSAFRERRGAAA
jgi:hypothetical protein